MALRLLWWSKSRTPFFCSIYQLSTVFPPLSPLPRAFHSVLCLCIGRLIASLLRIREGVIPMLTITTNLKKTFSPALFLPCALRSHTSFFFFFFSAFMSWSRHPEVQVSIHLPHMCPLKVCECERSEGDRGGSAPAKALIHLGPDVCAVQKQNPRGTG